MELFVNDICAVDTDTSSQLSNFSPVLLALAETEKKGVASNLGVSFVSLCLQVRTWTCW